MSMTYWTSLLMKSYVSSTKRLKRKPILARYGNSFLPAVLVLVSLSLLFCDSQGQRDHC
ncbi:hypothetical protein Gogos_021210 [Gossypium gossypioides]|uniref:Uncharacterized protein n=1 Tax=Gossypium gossypioides TaxID=34282 RepID=A0A7J9CZU8_GOSGO|nr:hypothetical protein [Gossypium gossypioides]